MIDIKQIIADISDRKIKDNITPVNVSRMEILKRIYVLLDKELDGLKLSGSVVEERTINDCAYRIKTL